MAQVSRRSFLAGLGASLVPARFAAAGNSPSVVVIGAGLAGLAATYDLKEAGADVRLIEMSNRPGGRIKTVRGHFADDAWVDLGGQTTGAFYANFFYYSSLFGLEFEAQTPPESRPDFLLHLNDRIYSGGQLMRDPSQWPVELAEHERPLAPFRLLGHYLGPVAQQIGNVADVLKPEFAKYDAMRLRELLEERGATAAAIDMINHSLNYNSVDSVSALSALRDAVRMLHMRGGQALNLQNGNSSLPEAFAARLGDAIRFEQKLVAVNQTTDGVQLQVETKAGTESLYADRVILAIPFTALRKVKFDSPLPTERRMIIDELPYTQIAQVFLQTKTRFWEQGGPVSAIVSDGPLERLFDASKKMQGERGLLINWVNGTGTGWIAADPEQHLAAVQDEIHRIWPKSRDQIETTLTNNWGQSYARGAYAHYAPGQLTRFAEEIPKPVGRLHFAGEHTELVAPGMEGALVSGKRAAAEIMGASDYT